MSQLPSQYQEIIALTKYSRWKEDQQRRETFSESVDRYIDFYADYLKENFNFSDEYLMEKLRHDFKNLRAFGSMRGLMSAGPALAYDHTRQYNCGYSPIDNPRVFSEIIAVSMAACGFGFSVEKQYVDQLPFIPKALIRSPDSIVVEDSKEGWAVAFDQFINGLYDGKILSVDTSKIRPHGAVLKTFGGRAAGPEPFERLVEFTTQIFLNARGRKLKPVEVHDIACMCGEIVVAGGVRRCLPGETKICTEYDGQYQHVSMEDINVGDLVITGDGKKNKVIGKVYQGMQELVDVRYLYKKTINSFACTANHKIAVFENQSQIDRGVYSWKQASELTDGDMLITMTKEGNLKPLKFLDLDYTGREDNTYDIQVENRAEFFGDGVLMHNSALISLSDLEDEEMRKAKSGAWWAKSPHRQMANNSIAFETKPSREKFDEEFDALVASCSGERGIFNRAASVNVIKSANEWRMETFSDDAIERDHDFAFGTNPCCVSGNTRVVTKEYGNITVLEAIEYFNQNAPISVMTSVGYQPIKNALATRFDAETITLVVKYPKGEKYLTVTPDHKIKTDAGWIEAQHVNKNHELTVLVNHLDVEDKVIGHLLKKEVNSTKTTTYDIQTDVSDFFASGVLVHNSEIILRPRQFCNLSTAIVRADDSLVDLIDKVRGAAQFGTIQSTLTNFRYISEDWKKNTEEERLLGVSMTGIMDHPVLNGSEGKEKRKAWLQDMKRAAVNASFELADSIGVPRSKAITCIKPEGTSSQLSDTASGMHVRYAPFYIRRIRLDSGDPVAKMMIDQGMKYDMTSFDKNGWFFNIIKKLPFGIWDKIKRYIGGVSYNEKTYIFSFPMKAPDGALTRKDETAIMQLENWLDFQTHWCEHKPSVTVSVKEEEWDDVREWVWEHFDKISGVSFLPYDGGSYILAPYEEITEKTYNKMSVPNLDWSKLKNYESSDLTEGAQNVACVAGGCEL